MKKVPKSIYEIGGQVDLSHNQIAELPSASVKSPALRSLDVSHNKISEIPSNINVVYTLVWLNLSYNCLEVTNVMLRGDNITMSIEHS